MAKNLLIPDERIERAILLIRSQKVMLDRDLAKLYGVATGVLNQAVKRNLRRFPEDFMFQLSKKETEIWISQIVISNPAAKMAVRKRPFAFTELGVAMLSSVLHSDRAIQVNMVVVGVSVLVVLVAVQEVRSEIRSRPDVVSRVGRRTVRLRRAEAASLNCGTIAVSSYFSDGLIQILR